MKKFLLCACALLLLFMLAGCAAGQDGFDATVLDVQQNNRSDSALVEQVQKLPDGGVSRSLIWVSVDPGTLPALSLCDTVTVVPDGEELLTHPSQLDAKSVTVKEKAAGALWGTVQEVRDASLLVDRLERTETGFAAKAYGDLYSVDIRAVENLPEIEAGDTVAIRFGGEILETYPAQITAEFVSCWEDMQAILGSEG